ncbi:uncharacterized protein LAESUDRAFT_760216 [Laetiporus sulphureus 93-53]|uniref:Fungal-type protein kinase domain-containing protein n=1 Tax=Laetiporus sulphureus 93-53 TaxID=1314785 RepID=A0A165DPE3_9APHY|nr:uncharacterized protein LAESUDRAFT_760216 [Laetiporus sulphureus 93-53]KZT05327.1 hypothetical protein LAESUDRAFT_760216 [Laetiporus sulphureus 93-53]
MSLPPSKQQKAPFAMNLRSQSKSNARVTKGTTSNASTPAMQSGIADDGETQQMVASPDGVDQPPKKPVKGKQLPKHEPVARTMPPVRGRQSAKDKQAKAPELSSTPQLPETPQRPSTAAPVIHITPSKVSSANSDFEETAKIDHIQASLTGFMVMNRNTVELTLWRWLHNGMSKQSQRKLEQTVRSFVNTFCEAGWPQLVNKTFTAEAQLYEPFVNIMHAVEDHFNHLMPNTIFGSARNVHKMQFAHAARSDDGTSGLHSSPDIAIFEEKKCSRGCNVLLARYCHVRNALEIKLQCNTSVENDAVQLGVYVRQMLIEQPDRRFAASFVFTERNLRLYGFDRSGVWHSPFIDFHKHPDLLVLAILFLHSNDHAIGRNTEIMLSKKSNKTSAVLKLSEMAIAPYCPMQIAKPTKTTNNDTTFHDIVVNADRWKRSRTIRSRGTTCWMGEICKSKKLGCVVKDYWRAANRTSEATMLLAAHGVNGVGEMFASRERERVSDFRGQDFLHKQDFFQIENAPEALNHAPDHVHCLLLLERYDGPLSCAPNPLQFLIAFHDCVCGHRDLLLGRGILHRDISFNNLMYYSAGTSGNTGKLIDLDLAANVRTLWNSGVATIGDFRTGTRIFQSVKVMYTDKTTFETLGPHNHLDDLESFFYVLAYYCATLDGPTTEVQPKPIETVRPFEDWFASPNMKSLWVREPHGIIGPTTYMQHIWSVVSSRMVEFFTPHVQFAYDVDWDRRYKRQCEAPPPPHLTEKQCMKSAVQDYQTFIGIIDDAISYLKDFNAIPEDAEPSTWSATPSNVRQEVEVNKSRVPRPAARRSRR